MPLQLKSPRGLNKTVGRVGRLIAFSNHGRAKPLWITEDGWPIQKLDGGVSPAAQADDVGPFCHSRRAIHRPSASRTTEPGPPHCAAAQLRAVPTPWWRHQPSAPQAARPATHRAGQTPE